MPARGCVTLLLLSALVATGCAGPGPQDHAPGSWREHSNRLSALHDWSATGKLALRSTTASESASLDWRQRGEETEVRLSGPLGVGTTTLYSDGRMLDIHRGDEHRRVALSDAGTLALDRGWELPLHALPRWLRGLPGDGLPRAALDLDPHTGHLTHFSQDGWEVYYDSYGEFDGVTLPTRLRIEGKDTRATILIRRWEPNARR